MSHKKGNIIYTVVTDKKEIDEFYRMIQSGELVKKDDGSWGKKNEYCDCFKDVDDDS